MKTMKINYRKGGNGIRTSITLSTALVDTWLVAKGMDDDDLDTALAALRQAIEETPESRRRPSRAWSNGSYCPISAIASVVCSDRPLDAPRKPLPLLILTVIDTGPRAPLLRRAAPQLHYKNGCQWNPAKSLLRESGRLFGNYTKAQSGQYGHGGKETPPRPIPRMERRCAVQSLNRNPTSGAPTI